MSGTMQAGFLCRTSNTVWADHSFLCVLRLFASRAICTAIYDLSRASERTIWITANIQPVSCKVKRRDTPVD